MKDVHHWKENEREEWNSEELNVNRIVLLMSTAFFLTFALVYFLTEVETNPYITAFLFFDLRSIHLSGFVFCQFCWLCWPWNVRQDVNLDTKQKSPKAAPYSRTSRWFGCDTRPHARTPVSSQGLIMAFLTRGSFHPPKTKSLLFMDSRPFLSRGIPGRRAD